MSFKNSTFCAYMHETRFLRVALFCILTLCCFALASTQSIAQITKTAHVELNDETTRTFFGRDIYLTEDTEKKLTAQILRSRHESNLRGKRINSNLFNPTQSDRAVWLLFSVINNSQEENWVLHFGNITDGRTGLIRHIEVQNVTTGDVFIRTKTETEDAKNTTLMPGAGLPVKIEKNKQQLFAIYLESAGSLPHTFAPSFMAENEHLQSLNFGSILSIGFIVFTLTLIGCFIAASGIKRDSTFLYFSAYFMLQGAAFFIWNHNLLISNTLVIALLNLLVILPFIPGILMTQRFLGFVIIDDTQNMFALMGAAFALVCFVLSQFLTSALPLVSQSLFFVPLIGIVALMAGISFTQSKLGKHGSALLSYGWLSILPGLCLLLMLSSGAATISPFVYWISLIPQGILFIFAALQKIELGQKEQISSVERENRAAQSLARLQQSKETADQARLLRVIERERELMADLREREIQRTQEMRKAKDMADEANRAKSAFLALVSHEIRTPMNGIMGMVRLLRDTNMTKQQNEYLQAVQNSGDTMMALLNDILDFEKIESGNMEIEVIDFDMTKLAEDVVTLMSGHADEKGITLASEIPDNFPAQLKGDPTRLRQVLLNLVSNAIKFTSEGSITIQLQAKPLERQDENAKNRYEVYCGVKDTGIGISEDAQKTLFNPFTQAEKSTTRKYGGTGLGLAICRNLVEAMGGKIEVESFEGQGSTFFFRANFAEGSKDFSENAFDIGHEGHEKPKAKPMRILVLDDNEMNQRVLEGFLNKDGHTTILCDNAQDALEQCERTLFDVVIADILLQDNMDGMEFTRKLRRHETHGTAHTPVIALSGNVSAEDRKDYKRANMNGFLAKPLDPEALRIALLKIESGKLDTPVIIPEITETDDQQEATETQASQENEIPDIVKMMSTNTEEEQKPVAQPLSFADEDEDDFDSFAQAEKEAPSSNPTAPEEPALFDPQLLNSLAESLPKEQFDELLSGFFDKTDELVNILIEAPEENAETATIKERAHELKGMCANFGLNGVSEIAATIEAAAKNNDRDTAVEEIKKLPEVNQRAQTQLKAWIASR